MGDVRGRDRRRRLGELALLFARLGFTSFGGPAAHTSLMQHEVVDRRGWVDARHFVDMVSAVNFVPGPNSTELAILIGQLRAGFAGLVVAGACFIVPAMLISIPLAWGYVTWGSLPRALPALRAVGAAIAAVVVAATWRFGRTAIRDPFAVVVGLCAAAAATAGWARLHIQPEVPVLAAAAVAGILRGRGKPHDARTLALALPALFWTDLGRLALGLLKIGATLFGSGYVLISYFESELVNRTGWLTPQQLVDAIAAGQFTPGPLLSSATFVGFVLGHSRFGGGVAGGVVAAVTATAAIFAPSFVLVAVFGPMLQRVRTLGWARSALDSMNAAVVGLMLVAAVRFALTALLVPASTRIDAPAVIIFLGCAAALRARVNSTWLVIVAVCVGTLLSLMRG